MNAGFDESRFPRVAAYIQQLPEGLDSFPACKAKASIHRKVYEFSERPLEGLPPRLQELIDDPPPASAWIPQCQALALVVAMVEARGLDQARESAWIREAATHLFASPMYRILMWAATTRMVFKTANLRWSAFFRGSNLSSRVGAKEATVRLHAPAELFHDDLAGIFTDVIFAAVNYTRDPESSAAVTLFGRTGGELEYHGSW